MPPIHGKKGFVKNGANTIQNIKKWSLDVDRETHETTSQGSVDLPWRTWIPGLNGAEGKMEGDINVDDTNGQLALIESMESDTPLTLELHLDEDRYFEVDGYITKFSPEAPVDDLESVSYDFKITGPGATTLITTP